jgi:hypothetical protein
MRRLIAVLALVSACNQADNRDIEKANQEHAQALANQRAQAESARRAEEETQRGMETEADAAMAARAKKIRHPFPGRPNALIDCVEKKGGPRPLTTRWHAGLAIDVAFSSHLGGDLLAQRFSNYASALSRCTAYSASTIERAILPALDSLPDFQSMSTLVAAAGDVCAMDADSTDECFTTKARALASLGR